MKAGMMRITIVVLGFLMCLGCLHSPRRLSAEGDVTKQVVSMLRERGDDIEVLSSYPQIYAKWALNSPDEIVVEGDHRAELEELFANLYGSSNVVRIARVRKGGGGRGQRLPPDTVVRRPHGKGIYCQHSKDLSCILLLYDYEQFMSIMLLDGMYVLPTETEP
jgi:hypothetical protein